MPEPPEGGTPNGSSIGHCPRFVASDFPPDVEGARLAARNALSLFRATMAGSSAAGLSCVDSAGRNDPAKRDRPKARRYGGGARMRARYRLD